MKTSLLRAGLALAAVLAVCVSTPVLAGGPYRPLGCGQTVTDSLRYADRNVSTGFVSDTLQASLAGTGNTYFTLRNTLPNGQTLQVYDLGWNAETEDSALLLNRTLRLGLHYVVVRRHFDYYDPSTYKGRYGVQLTCSNQRIPAYQTIGSATTVALGQRVQGTLAGQGDQLWNYKYDPSAPPRYDISNYNEGYFPGVDKAFSFTMPATGGRVQVRSFTGTKQQEYRILQNTSTNSLLTASARFNSGDASALLAGGAYYVTVEQASTSLSQPYDFTVQQYCVPGGGLGQGSYLSMNGQSSYYPSVSEAGYKYFPIPFSAYPGQPVTGYVGNGYANGDYAQLYNRILLDFNGDGSFDPATEVVAVSTAAQQEWAYSFFLSPYDPQVRALVGRSVAMRLQGSTTPLSGSACSYLPNGYTIDCDIIINDAFWQPVLPTGTLGFSQIREAKSAPGSERYNRVRVAPDGNSYAAGAFSGTGTFKGGAVTQAYASAGLQDGMLCRYTKAGALAWVTRFGSAGDDEALGLAVDKFGYAYVSGYFSNSMSIVPATGTGQTLVSAGGTDGFLAKIHPDGHLVWAFRTGAAGNDRNNAVDIAPDLRIYLAGSFIGQSAMQGISGTVVNLVSRGNSDAFIAKFTDLGSLYWVMQVGGPGNDFGYGAAADPRNDGAYLLGSFEATATVTQVVAGGTGNTLGSYASAGGSDGFVARMPAGGYYLYYMAVLGGPTNENVRDIAADPAGGSAVAVGGFSGTSAFFGTAKGYYDAFAVRLVDHFGYPPNYQVAWKRSLGGFGQDQANGVRLDRGGNPLVSGYFSGTPTEVFGSPAQTLTSAGGTDAFISKLDGSTGYNLYTTRVGGSGDDAGLSVDSADAYGAVACGSYSAMVNFPPITPAITSAGLTDGWVAKYAYGSGTGREGLEEGFGNESAAIEGSGVTVYPNPTTGRITLANLPAEMLGTQAHVLDLSGKVVADTTLQSEMDLAHLPPGLYYLTAGSLRLKVALAK